MTPQRKIFDPLAPLARGVSVIEASAGTGKTYQITNLLLRLIAEEAIGVDELLVVTFTKAATAELRDRVRARVVEAIAAIERTASGEPVPSDPVLAHLARDDGDGRGRRLEALRLARQDFDAAAISTIHGFCRTVLQEHAFEAEVDLQVELVTGPGGLLGELVDDWLVRRLYAEGPDAIDALLKTRKLTRARLLALAQATDAAAPGAPGRPRSAARGIRLLPDEVLLEESEWLAVARPALARWQKEGRDKMIEAARAAGLAKIYTFKKDGTPTAVFEGRLELIDAFLADAAVGRAELRGGEAWVDLKKLRKEWPALDPATIPGLDDVDQLEVWALGENDDETRAFLLWLRAQLPLRMAQRGQRSFSDLLSLVADAVAREPDGKLVRTLRARYRAVLIDEFQDTDDKQWSVFHTVFGAARGEAGTPSHWLYLIGDPKQAIYSFRNADVFVYLEAKRAATSDTTMDVNHRSDGRFVHAMNVLFGDKERVFEQPGLTYVEVKAKPEHEGDPRLLQGEGPPTAAPLQLRLLDQRALRVGQLEAQPIDTRPPAEGAVARCVADDVVALLASSPPLFVRGARPVQAHPGHVAVLVRRHVDGTAIARELRRRGVPCIVSSPDSVFTSEEAEHVRALLEAVSQPRSAAAARALAATPLLAWSGPQLAQLVDGGELQPDWTDLLASLSSLARRFERDGFAATFGGFLQEPARLRRIARLEEGERRLTNYRHLLELLHATATEERLGLVGLLRWLREQRRDEESQVEDDPSELRLESDARAVQIVTLHKAKGLQYEFVFAPYLWDHRTVKDGDAVIRYHVGAQQLVDARLAREAKHRATAVDERAWENLRLLYVALTRAKHRAWLYWPAWSGTTESAPLSQVLFGGGDPTTPRSTLAAARVATALEGAGCKALEEQLDALVARSVAADGRPSIAWSWATPPGHAPAPLGASSEAWLDPHTFPSRPLELDWRRASFSSLVGTRHFATVEEERRLEAVTAAGPPRPISEAGDQDGGEGAKLATGADAELPLAAFPRGTEAGTFVHKVLELLDFPSRRERNGRRRELRTLIHEEGPRFGIRDEEQLELLVEQLPVVLDTPLGPDMPALSQISAADRLDELSFDLALRGGDDFTGGPGAYISASALKQTFAAGLAGVPAPKGYVDAVAEEGFAFPRLAGFLTGSIDLVFRVGAGDDQRWYVCDYKTNALHSKDAEGRRRCTQADFAKERLADEMAKHHYYLQYHLYLVALRRLLRQRLGARFDPERHVGGVAYAFVRGMIGRDTPRDHAVFFHRPTTAALDALDALLVGEGAP